MSITGSAAVVEASKYFQVRLRLVGAFSSCSYGVKRARLQPTHRSQVRGVATMGGPVFGTAAELYSSVTVASTCSPRRSACTKKLPSSPGRGVTDVPGWGCLRSAHMGLFQKLFG